MREETYIFDEEGFCGKRRRRMEREMKTERKEVCSGLTLGKKLN